MVRSLEHKLQSKIIESKYSKMMKGYIPLSAFKECICVISTDLVGGFHATLSGVFCNTCGGETYVSR